MPAAAQPAVPITQDADKPRGPARASAPASIIDFWLGQQLRLLRKQRGRSLVQVAQACGISLGLLSQIERGLSSPSVKILSLLAGELGVSVDSLLRGAGQCDTEAGGRLARAGSHRRVDLADKGIHKEMYTPPAGRTLDLCRACIEPGGSTGEELFSTSMGEQVGLVLRGQLELWFEDRVVLLGAGDSFCYDSRTPRRWRNPGSDVAEVIWAISRIDHQEGGP
ncbi:helix-turn-helix domain-containing protein [Bordetella petrii]|uniref:helix-turn-helix domain-containing protein n=1 Tax=Bordetella petrii TaxID=94624 RepID=UPI00339D0BF5